MIEYGQTDNRSEERQDMNISFEYPYGGLIFYTDEEKAITVKINGVNGDFKLICSLFNYNGEKIFESKDCIKPVDSKTTYRLTLPIKYKGYYKFTVRAESGECFAEKSTGIGLTVPHERSGDNSVFGISCNFWNPATDPALYERVGIRYLRNPGKETTIKAAAELKKHGMYSQVQLQGGDMFSPKRWADSERNTAYYYQKQYGDISRLIEHGNEHWEEKNLGLLAEWVKSTGLARLKADPEAWHSGSGVAGVDINKMQIMCDQGMYDYITFIAVHNYSFPQRPESPESYWSIERLRDLAEFMKKNKIEMPVCCTEQGYPAMYDQNKCESYSPGDLVTLEAQADYLVRSWLIFISYGVAKVLWFNGPWYDGFGIQEKDGPAPWPAMMALCQLIREVDGATYIGDLKNDKNVCFKVFRQKDGSLTAAIWRPIYYSRSCEKEKNLSLDLTGTQADGNVKEHYSYVPEYIDHKRFEARNIMGNPIETGASLKIGESPIYISGISEDIIPHLHDETLFTCKNVCKRPLPPSILLGICDVKPSSDAYVSSRFFPGQTRTYKLRVHNFSGEDLNDVLIITAPKQFYVFKEEITVTVAAGQTEEYAVKLTCRPAADVGCFKIHARLKAGNAHPVYQLAGIYSPFVFEPIYGIPSSGEAIKLKFTNHSDKTHTYKMHISGCGIEFSENVQCFTAAAGQEISIALPIAGCREDFVPAVNIKLETEGCTAEYNPVIPVRMIAPVNAVTPCSVISGWDISMTAGERYNGPELFGTGSPEKLDSNVRFSYDDSYIYGRFEVFDNRVVCVKNTRRNNIDSDGVWIRLYRDINDEKPYRHFSIVPADQAGRACGCYVNEVSAGVKFAYPYTDYDMKNISVSSEIFKDRYIINVKIKKSSIEMFAGKNSLIMDIRVINMNDDDWPRFYDTGKSIWKLIKI